MIIHVEINLFDHSRRTRSYGVYSATSPILPCEQLYFSKEFVGYKTIADLLRSFEREPIMVRLWAEHTNVPIHSPSRQELLAEYEDNALNVLYPYHTLHPSYDHVSRRLHLASAKLGNRPVLARLTLSVAISGDGEPSAINRRSTSASTTRRSSPSRPYSQPLVSPRPAYMEPTFSWLMSEHTTRQRFHPSPSNDQIRNANQNGAGRLPRSASDYLRREY